MENPHLELWGFLALLICTEKIRISQEYEEFLGVRLCVEYPSPHHGGRDGAVSRQPAAADTLSKENKFWL